jgi:plasmid stability protein
MATITVRNLDEDVQQRIKRQAAANNRSMEAEARAILSAAVQNHGLEEWIAATEGLRGDDLPIPLRSPARELDLS